jgi:hypothetical protein
VVFGYPRFRREIFEVDPCRRARPRGHRRLKPSGNLAAECFDDDVTWRYIGKRIAPAAHRHAGRSLRIKRYVKRGTQACKRFEIVDPKPHADFMFRRELPRQPPAHADVAVVIDDAAKNIPGRIQMIFALCVAAIANRLSAISWIKYFTFFSSRWSEANSIKHFTAPHVVVASDRDGDDLRALRRRHQPQRS